MKNMEQNKNFSSDKRRVSIRTRMVVIFGSLIIAAMAVVSTVSIFNAQGGIMEQVKGRLRDKSTDISEIIDGRIRLYFELLKGITNIPAIKDTSISLADKARILSNEMKAHKEINTLGICNDKGLIFDTNRVSMNIENREWYKTAISGKNFISEPAIATGTGLLAMTFAIPIEDDGRIIGVLIADVDGFWLASMIKDIVVGKHEGGVSIVNKEGKVLAEREEELVKNEFNIIEKGKSEKRFASLASFLQMAINAQGEGEGFYEYEGKTKIAGYSKLKSADWRVISSAGAEEFLDSVNKMKINNIALSIIVLLISLGIV